MADTSKLIKSSLGLIGSSIGSYMNLSPIKDTEQYKNQALQLGNSNYQLGSLLSLTDLFALQNAPQQLTGNDLYNPTTNERLGLLFSSGISGFDAGLKFFNSLDIKDMGVTNLKETNQLAYGGGRISPFYYIPQVFDALSEELLMAGVPSEGRMIQLGDTSYKDSMNVLKNTGKVTRIGNMFDWGGELDNKSMLEAASGLAMAGINMGINAIGSYQRRKLSDLEAKAFNALMDFSTTRNLLDFQRAINDSTDNMFNMAALQMKAEGGPLFTNGGMWSNGLTFIGNGGTHEENPFEGVPMGVAPDGIPNLVEEGEVIYNDYVFSDRLKISKKMLDKYMLPSKYKGKSYAEVSKELSKESEERPNDPISKKGLEDSMAKLQLAQEEYKTIRDLEKINKLFAFGGKVRKYSGLDNVSSSLNTGNITLENYNPVNNRLELLRLGITPETPEILPKLEEYNPLDNMMIRTKLGIFSNNLQDKFTPVKQKINLPKMEKKDSTEKKQLDNQDNITKSNKSTTFDTNSILRYIPTLIQGIQALKGNKVDYTNPNLIAANTRNINFTPLGDYMALERLPFVSTIGNKMQAQQAATNATIQNVAANRAAAIPSLITSGYKGQIALADAALEAAKYNNALSEAEVTFNRGTNLANLTAGLDVAKTNLRLAYESAIQQAAMREAIDLYISESNSTNATTFLDNLLGIGREMDAIREAKKTMAANAAYGGKLSKRKKKGLTC